jgi:hypothetical protein
VLAVAVEQDESGRLPQLWLPVVAVDGGARLEDWGEV